MRIQKKKKNKKKKKKKLKKFYIHTIHQVKIINYGKNIIQVRQVYFRL